MEDLVRKQATRMKKIKIGKLKDMTCEHLPIAMHDGIFDFKDDDIFWCTSDPGWVTGHTYAIYSPLINGITTLLFEGAPDWPTQGRWAEIIEKHKATIFYK